MKIPKNRKVHTKSTKFIPNQVINFQKITQNPSIFRDPKFGEITPYLQRLQQISPAVRNNVGNGICDGVELRREEEEEMRFGFCHVPRLIWSKDSDRIVLCFKRAEGF